VAAKNNKVRARSKPKARLAPMKKRVARKEADCRRRSTTQRARTFRRADDGLAALLATNPGLAELLESDCSQACGHYRRWRRNGRRGPKVPMRTNGEGRFDPLDVALDRKGKRRISSWLEAAYAGVPPSRHWQDFRSRLGPLADATGLRLALPEPAYRLEDDQEAFAQCHEQAERDLAEAMAQRPRTRRKTRRKRPKEARKRARSQDVPSEDVRPRSLMTRAQ